MRKFDDKGIPVTKEGLKKENEEFRETINQMHRLLLEARAGKDGAYAERNQCVALIAKMALALGFRSGVARHPADDLSWEDDWRTIVFVDLPTGQLSWHFHDSEKHLLDGLPPYLGKWDGHATGEKYCRVNKFPADYFARAAPSAQLQEGE